MLTRNVHIAAAVLSGVTASLLVGATTLQAQENPVVVYAEPDENTRTVHVSYADLNLAEQQGERALRSRVASAVKQVCSFEYGRAGFQDAGFANCAGAAKSDAAPQITQAVERARQIALTGQSSIATAAITIRVPAS